MIRYLDIYLVHGELLFGGLVLVARVLDDVVIEGVSGLHGRGRHVERSPPDFHLSNTFVRDDNNIFTWIYLHLVLPMLGGSLGLVEASQPSVVPLIQPPALLHGEVGLPNLRQDGPE